MNVYKHVGCMCSHAHNMRVCGDRIQTCESEAADMLLMCVAGGREITNMFLNW